MNVLERKCMESYIGMIVNIIEPKYIKAPTHPNPYWIRGSDDGDDYCDGCIDDAVSKAKKANVGDTDADDITRDGGWAQEKDTSSFCATCGVKLNYTLTDYGAQKEIEHFIEALDKVNGIVDLSEDESEGLTEALSVAECWIGSNESEMYIPTINDFLKKALPLC